MNDNNKHYLILGLIVLIVGGVLIVSRTSKTVDEEGAEGPSKLAEPEFITVAIKLKLQKPKIGLLADNSRLDNRFLKPSTLIKQALGATSFLEDNPDVFMVMNVEGSDDAFTDGKTHMSAEGQTIITNLKVPYRYKGRFVVLDIWDDDSGENRWKNAVEGFGSVSAEALPFGVGGSLTIDSKKLGQVFENKDDRIGQIDFALPSNEGAREEFNIYGEYAYDLDELKTMHKVLLIKDDFNSYVSRLIQQNVISLDDSGDYRLIIGSVQASFFFESSN